MEDLANDQVQVRLVAEAHNLFGLQFCQIAKQFRRRAGSFESVRADDLGRGEADYFTKDFGGLHRAQPRAGEDGIGLYAKCKWRTRYKRIIRLPSPSVRPGRVERTNANSVRVRGGALCVRYPQDSGAIHPVIPREPSPRAGHPRPSTRR